MSIDKQKSSDSLSSLINEFGRESRDLAKEVKEVASVSDFNEEDPNGDKEVLNIELSDIGYFDDDGYFIFNDNIENKIDKKTGYEYLLINGVKYYNSINIDHCFRLFGKNGKYTGIYLGSYNNGNANGYGIRFLHNKIDKGLWKDDKLIPGKSSSFVTLDDGSFFEGDLDSTSGFMRSPHGKGIKTYSNGDFQNGTWENGKFIEGEVRLSLGDNWLFEGHYKNGKFSGKGKLTQKVGDLVKSVYEGEFLEGEMNGKCTSYTQFNDKGEKTLDFKGEMKDGKMWNGTCERYTKVDNDGNFIDFKGKIKDGNIADGEGIKVFDNGDVYEGDFIDGETLYYYKDNNLSKEMLNYIAETKLDASGKMTYKNGEGFDEIKIHSGILHSKAKWLFSDRNSALDWSDPRGNVIYTKDIDLSNKDIDLGNRTIDYSLSSWNSRKDIRTTRKFDGNDYIYDNTSGGGGEIKIQKTGKFGENASITVANILNFLKDNHDQYQITKFSEDGNGIEATQKKKPHEIPYVNSLGEYYGTIKFYYKGDTLVLSDVSDFGGKSAEDVAKLLNMYFFKK